MVMGFVAFDEGQGGSDSRVFDGGGRGQGSLLSTPEQSAIGLQPSVLQGVYEATAASFWEGRGGLFLLYAAIALVGLFLVVIIVLLLLRRSRPRKVPQPLVSENSYQGNQSTPSYGSHKNHRTSVFGDRTAAFVNLGTLPPTMTKMKIPAYASSSSNSSSDNESGLEGHFPHCIPVAPGSKFGKGSFKIGPVQPISENNPSHVLSHPSSPEGKAHEDEEEERLPKITFSLSRHESNEEEDPKTADKGIKFNLNLIKASNLTRCGSTSPSASIASAFRSSRPGGHFVPEGIFGRIYKSTDNAKNSLKRQSSEDDSSKEGSDNEFKQTTIIKSKKSKTIKFPSEPILLKQTDFPIRLTIYDVDRHRVRFALGHTFVELTDEQSYSFGGHVILTRNLYPTLYRAKNCTGQ